MPDLTISSAVDTLLQASNAAGIRTAAGLGALASITPGTGVATAAGNNLDVVGGLASYSAVLSAVTGMLDFKGNLDCSANPNYPSASKGDTYYVSVAGKVGGASGKTVAVGDAVIAKADNAGGTEAGVGTSWFVLEKNLDGALLSASNLSDVANAGTARTNLGLGALATVTPGTGVATALAVNVGSAGAFTIFGGVGDFSTITGTSTLTLGVASTTDGEIVLKNAANSYTTTIKTGATGASYTLTLPVDDGTNGQVLTTNGSGVLSWSTGGGGASVADDGGVSIGLTATNGVAATARRSDGTPALSQAIEPTWTAAHIFSKSGAASVSAVKLTGVPFAGTGTTSFPLLYINDANATASTTLSTAGTYFGINGDGTQDLMKLMLDGASRFQVTYDGRLNLYNKLIISNNGLDVTGAIQCTNNSSYIGYGGGSNYLGGNTFFRTTAGGGPYATIETTTSAAYIGISGKLIVCPEGATTYTSGPASSSTKITKATASIADNVATSVLTVTIPNASHSGSLRVRLCGKLGAGGAIGAGEASGTIIYDFAIARTAGLDTVVGTSSAYGSATASVAGGATITVTAAATGMSGAASATQTFTVQVTIARGSGSSTNHTCLVEAEILNANATGITLS